jgi:hypothetical protein
MLVKTDKRLLFRLHRYIKEVSLPVTEPNIRLGSKLENRKIHLRVIQTSLEANGKSGVYS